MLDSHRLAMVLLVSAIADGRWRLLFEQEVPLPNLSEAGKS
jgi:hypothetical protein